MDVQYTCEQKASWSQASKNDITERTVQVQTLISEEKKPQKTCSVTLEMMFFRTEPKKVNNCQMYNFVMNYNTCLMTSEVSQHHATQMSSDCQN